MIQNRDTLDLILHQDNLIPLPKLHRYDLRIFDVISCLHGANCGSGDGIADDRREILETWLRLRLQHWSAGPFTSSYDDTVRDLVSACLFECDAWHRGHDALKRLVEIGEDANAYDQE